MDVTDRLDKIEMKLDTIAVAMTAIARGEEKQAAMEERLLKQELRLDKAAAEFEAMQKHIHTIELQLAKNDTVTMDLKKVWGVIVTAAIGAAFYIWRT